jgi:hypothetical protein
MSDYILSNMNPPQTVSPRPEQRIRTYRVFYYTPGGAFEECTTFKAMNFADAERIFTERQPDFVVSEISRVDFRVNIE